MRSSVLVSKRAIQINIRIMRVFNQIRNGIIGTTDLRFAISEMKHAVEKISRNRTAKTKA